ATTVPAYRKRNYTGRQRWSALRYVPGRNWPTIVYSARDCRVLTLAKLSAGLPKPNNPSRRRLCLWREAVPADWGQLIDGTVFPLFLLPPGYLVHPHRHQANEPRVRYPVPYL